MIARNNSIYIYIFNIYLYSILIKKNALNNTNAHLIASIIYILDVNLYTNLILLGIGFYDTTKRIHTNSK